METFPRLKKHFKIYEKKFHREGKNISSKVSCSWLFLILICTFYGPGKMNSLKSKDKEAWVWILDIYDRF